VLVDLNCNIYFRANMTCNAKPFRATMTYNPNKPFRGTMTYSPNKPFRATMIHWNSNRRIIMRIPSTYDYRIFFLIIDYAFSIHIWTGNSLEQIYLYCTLQIPHVHNKAMYEFGVIYAFMTLFSLL
jgi:hypothetical protein